MLQFIFSADVYVYGHNNGMKLLPIGKALQRCILVSKMRVHSLTVLLAASYKWKMVTSCSEHLAKQLSVALPSLLDD